MLAEDKAYVPHVIASLQDESKQKELLVEDEEEDFLDEGISNSNRIQNTSYQFMLGSETYPDTIMPLNIFGVWRVLLHFISVIII